MPRRFLMAHKLWLAVIAIVALLAAVLGVSAQRLDQAQDAADANARDMQTRVQAAMRWFDLVDSNATRTLAVILSHDPAIEAEFGDAIAATAVQIGEVQRSLEAMALSGADKALMDKIVNERSASVVVRDQAHKLKSTGQHDQAVALVKQSFSPAVTSILQGMQDFVKLQQQSALTSHQQALEARTQTEHAAALMIGLLLLAIVVGAHYLIGSIRRPLAQACELAERIAGGDLSRHQAVESVTRTDEFGDLLRALYRMSAALGHMVQQVRLGSDSIALASAEIATGNHDLSARTEQTSSNLEQTAAAMEQFTSTIEQSAGSAQQASSLAAGATGVARRGGEVVTQVVATMEDINHSSKKIADIIGVIDGIAFQTNILALNAAVEAARAGEQGRGFAVVASEVRNLAQRSAEAAKEIKQLIKASVEKVETGTRLVSDAGSTMTDIVQSVQRVTDMIGEITAAAAEQSAGVSQVNKAIGNLDQMTQENAALVEQSASATQSLREQADHLAREVSVFKVSADGGGAQPGMDTGRSAMAPPPAPRPQARPPMAPKAQRLTAGTAQRTKPARALA